MSLATSGAIDELTAIGLGWVILTSLLVACDCGGMQRPAHATPPAVKRYRQMGLKELKGIWKAADPRLRRSLIRGFADS
ncbi:MAG: hypothetical protein WDZ31_10475, partial [Phycisphaeraceae bacterium]